MEQYKDGFVITEINPLHGGKVVFLNGDEITPGQVVGDIAETDMRRIQIRETIISHFQKEAELFKNGIKTLSLFFIDEVKKYREYSEDGEELLGEYGKIFEQEYQAIKEIQRQKKEEEDKKTRLLTEEEVGALREGLRKKWEMYNFRYGKMTHKKAYDNLVLLRK